MMARKIAGCLGVVLACLFLSACGANDCPPCVDCPDFTGNYLINQAPQGAICESYYLATGQFPYEVTVQDGSHLEIMFYGDPVEHYVGKICASEDSNSPRAFSFSASYFSPISTDENLTITLAGEFVEPSAGEPARMAASISYFITNSSDPSFNCNMIGDSSGYRID